MALIRNKLSQHGLLEDTQMNVVQARETIRVGAFEVEFFHVTHSIVDSFALAIRTPLGTLIHTGDFKIDPTPIDGRLFDLHKLAAYGDQGVLALSRTRMRNARDTRAGTHGERRRLESIFRTSKGRIILSCFTRFRVAADRRSAREPNRFVGFLGRRMSKYQVAEELGTSVPPKSGHCSKDIRNHPRDRVCVVAGGCQGNRCPRRPHVARRSQGQDRRRRHRHSFGV
jgi:ribonuclease J